MLQFLTEIQYLQVQHRHQLLLDLILLFLWMLLQLQQLVMELLQSLAMLQVRCQVVHMPIQRLTMLLTVRLS